MLLFDRRQVLTTFKIIKRTHIFQNFVLEIGYYAYKEK